MDEIEHEREVKDRLIDHMQKNGIKQVDVAKETGKILNPHFIELVSTSEVKCVHNSLSVKIFLKYHTLHAFTTNYERVGIHHSTLSLWLQGKVKGHMVKVGETIENYLDSYGMQKQSRMNTWGFQKMCKNKDNLVGFSGEKLGLDVTFIFTFSSYQVNYIGD